ncbi:MAG: hypothetical protein IJJ28_02150, partial [Lentisphaeria bacterium]|nr:hypothetical protein [Lentisphaeria bacterium]
RGVKFYDHHSVNLVHRYDTREEMRNVILHSQPHLPFSPCREAAATWRYHGSLLNDWRMIDTTTLRPLYYPQYTAEGFCHRNPDFIAAYCEYVKKLIADTAIDGISTDDSKHYMHFRSCACPVCRAALRERAGIDLPPASDAEFWGNWDNPAWRAWIDLRFESAAIFQKAVRGVLPAGFPMMSCGGKSAGPNAPSSGSDAVYFLEGCNVQHLELCGNTPPYKHDPVTWNRPIISHFANASYDAAAAEKVGARCICVGFGFVEATANIVWAVNKAMGAGCWFSTLKGRLGLPPAELAKLPDDISPAGRAFGFERRHPELFDTRPIRQLGVFFSRETRDHTLFGNLTDGHSRDFSNTLQLIAGAGISVGTVLEMPEDTRTYQLLLLPGVAALTADETRKLRNFAAAGGKVLINGPSGVTEAHSPWRLPRRTVKPFWQFAPGTAEVGPGVMEWRAERIPEPDLSAAAWREILPGVWYDPARLPDAALADTMLELVRKYMRPLPVTLRGADGYLTTVHRKDDGAYIVHLLAADFDTDIDHRLDGMRTHRSRVNLITKVEPINVAASFTVETDREVEVYTPFDDAGAKTVRSGREVTVELPDKCSYVILRIAPRQD